MRTQKGRTECAILSILGLRAQRPHEQTERTATHTHHYLNLLLVFFFANGDLANDKCSTLTKLRAEDPFGSAGLWREP